MVKCTKCSTENEENAAYCQECGDKLPIDNLGYVVCDVCYGIHKLTEFELPEDYQTCPCGGNYNYIKNIENVEPPTKRCMLCGAENPYSNEKCSQLWKNIHKLSPLPSNKTY